MSNANAVAWQRAYGYAWVRCPTCQTKMRRHVRTPGSTWLTCRICFKPYTVSVTIGAKRLQVTVAPAVGV